MQHSYVRILVVILIGTTICMQSGVGDEGKGQAVDVKKKTVEEVLYEIARELNCRFTVERVGGDERRDVLNMWIDGEQLRASDLNEVVNVIEK